MLDDQRNATFIIVDTLVEGVVPATIIDLLQRLRRAQTPVSLAWVDESIRLNTIVDVKQYIVQPAKSHEISRTQTTRSPPVATHQSPNGMGSLQSKRKISQLELDSPLTEVRPSGIIRKATDPRVKARTSLTAVYDAESIDTTATMADMHPFLSARRSSSSEVQSQAVKSGEHFDAEHPGQKAPIDPVPPSSGLIAAENSIDEPTGITTLQSTSSPADLKPVVEVNLPLSTSRIPDLSLVLSKPQQSPRLPDSLPTAATPGSAISPHSLELYRPDTPPLPPGLLTCEPNLTPPETREESLIDPNNGAQVTELPGQTMNLIKRQLDPDSPRGSDSTTSSPLRSFVESPMLRVIDNDDLKSSMSRVGSCDLTEASDGDPSPGTPRGDGFPGSSVPRTPDMIRFKVGSANNPPLSGSSKRRTQEISTDVSDARLDQLVNELHQWLNNCPTCSRLRFLKDLESKVRNDITVDDSADSTEATIWLGQ